LIKRESVDMWAAGCVLYTILCGYQPFYQQYVADLIETIKEGNFDFTSEVWKYVSTEAKNLILCLLDTNPEMRLSPADAMTHEWFQEYKSPNAQESRDSRLIMQSNLRINKRRLTRCLNEEDLQEFMPKRLSFNKVMKSKCLEDLDLSRSDASGGEE
jgi:serine/threonine protein kinase